VLILLSLLIGFSKLPKIQQDEPSGTSEKFNVFKYPHLLFGIISIFMYVGAEVAIGSFIIRFAGLNNIAGLTEQEAKMYVVAYMACAAAGRFLGSYLLG